MVRRLSTIFILTMPIERWTVMNAQDMENVRFIYFACNAVSPSLKHPIKPRLTDCYQAWTWDVITSISDEINIFKGRRLALVDVVYVFSR